jgi:hypothetical protein
MLRSICISTRPCLCSFSSTENSIVGIRLMPLFHSSLNCRFSTYIRPLAAPRGSTGSSFWESQDSFGAGKTSGGVAGRKPQADLDSFNLTLLDEIVSVRTRSLQTLVSFSL